VEAREDDVAGLDLDLRHELRSRAAGVELHLRASHVQEDPRVAVGAEPIGASFGRAVQDRDTRLAGGLREARHVRDHRPRGRSEVRQRRQVADHAALDLLRDERRVPRVDEIAQLDRHRQKFCGRPRPRRAITFFWISDVPPPIVSTTV
jgi:hypothetical protein